MRFGGVHLCASAARPSAQMRHAVARCAACHAVRQVHRLGPSTRLVHLCASASIYALQCSISIHAPQRRVPAPRCAARQRGAPPAIHRDIDSIYAHQRPSMRLCCVHLCASAASIYAPRHIYMSIYAPRRPFMRLSGVHLCTSAHKCPSMYLGGASQRPDATCGGAVRCLPHSETCSSTGVIHAPRPSMRLGVHLCASAFIYTPRRIDVLLCVSAARPSAQTRHAAARCATCHTLRHVL